MSIARDKYGNLETIEKGRSVAGAPWFSETYNEAWGVHSESGYYPDENDAIFMPVRYLEDFGLRVLTSP